MGIEKRHRATVVPDATIPDVVAIDSCRTTHAQAETDIDGDSACRLYDSCKSVAVVGETIVRQSGFVRTETTLR